MRARALPVLASYFSRALSACADSRAPRAALSPRARQHREFSFKPDIGTAKLRPKPDDSQGDFTDRLCYEYETRNALREKLRQKHEQKHDAATGQPLFTPLVGRGPAAARAAPDSTIHESLHAQARQAESERAARARVHDEEARQRASTSHTSDTSAKMLGEMKLRSFSEVYRALLASVELQMLESGAPGTGLYADDEKWRQVALDVQLARPEQLTQRDVAAIVRDMLDGLGARRSIAFDEFCGCLDQALSRDLERNGPRSSSALLRPHKREPPAAPDQLADCTFKPRIDPTSREMAGRMGSKAGKPVAESLMERSAEVRRGLEQRREQLAAAELADCTFAPEITNRARSMRDLDGNAYPLVRGTPSEVTGPEP